MPESAGQILKHDKTRETFSKEERLTRKKLIDKLTSTGASIKVTSFVLVHLHQTLPCPYPAQVMVTVSKRNFKRAHDRNRIKRLMREAYRKQKQTVYEVLENKRSQATLMIIFTGRSLPDQAYTFGKISELLRRYTSHLANANDADEKAGTDSQQ
ncbi:MAG: ribonuclease P protein component [Flavobacteriales bacterium]